MIKIIAAAGNYIPDKGFPIGKGGKMPWHVPADLKWFRETTEMQTVVMGRGTYEAIGRKPLPNRMNFIVSSTMSETPEGFDGLLKSAGEIVGLAESLIGDIYVIGGAELYRACISEGIADMVLVDRIDIDVTDADTFMDPLDDNVWEFIPCSNPVDDKRCFVSMFMHRKMFNSADSDYQKLVRDILQNGSFKQTRAGAVRSVFGRQLRFDLRYGLPALTTKRVYTNGVIHELLWFLKGDTNIKYLVDNNVHIWDDDAYRYYLELVEKNNRVFCGNDAAIMGVRYFEPLTKGEFLEAVSKEGECWFYLDEKAVFMSYDPNQYHIHYRYGDLGPVYGKQWRDWFGTDQIRNVIETLKTNPDDRRILVSAWNVGALDDMALPPCHYAFQFWTSEMDIGERMDWAARHNLNCWDGKSLDEQGVPSRKLSCMFNMRSTDVGCGMSFNVVSYAILTHMIAQCANMVPHELIYSVGDAHVYSNHIQGLKEQLSRNPHKYALPTLELNPDVKNINEFTFNDIKIRNYQSYPAIKLQLNTGL